MKNLSSEKMDQVNGGECSVAGGIALAAGVAGAVFITGPVGAAIFAVGFISGSIDFASGCAE